MHATHSLGELVLGKRPASYVEGWLRKWVRWLLATSVLALGLKRVALALNASRYMRKVRITAIICAYEGQ